MELTFAAIQYILNSNMKGFLAAAILISFAAIAFFGYTAVHIEKSHPKVRCITEQMRGAQCPDARNQFAVADFHLGALKSFSLAIAEGGGMNFVSGLAVLFAAMLLAIAAPVLLCVPQVPQFLRGFPARAYLFCLRPKFTHWLALHENSPTIHFGRE
ncbi:MAG: hypothetical protein A3I38_02800 [Candidatus Wildermuthbacteria bacterium RIFCSPLOWO2_02_FULL_47_10]|uniref:Uncharacterized protein n=1 Tax=Candidatus Wildermuthbacteria bacterium RIFCSPHIGHO2_02_FULL_47_17 TaxID=1802452 RepID=A0A1G2R4A0_9BACT|nr:MAG: hypothetical protein UY15_C0021G0025 [Parcubacteria group bacterium GW2011_GWA2_47_9]OHA67388.1 MAG: hypothetical protein A3D59_01325 [Candidatus Wildermuthbacteria bacterium RIFCSPHIGHO2_02_FULL_47_17]OHA76139.1 MAG: hypothetical protein A3I38_02800 [Candidatus Wildermuthbacteria bacterium RIFCSPLOWO2_02_FULL_47_10]